MVAAGSGPDDPDANPAVAASCPPEHALHLRGGTARLENDLFAGTDRNYTNGVTLALVSNDFAGQLVPACLPRPLALYARFITRVDPGFWRGADAIDAPQNVVLRAGQAMYTPADKTRSDVVSDDRPYAGLLYLSMAWNRRVPLQGTRLEMLDVRELTLGVIGPWSLAEQTQDFVHRVRGIERFRGWDNQLHNEPAFRMAMERKFKRRAEGSLRPGWGTEAIGSYALSVGNIETAAGVGIELRGGWNLPNDFGSDPIRPGAENRAPFASTGTRGERPGLAAAPPSGAHAFIKLDAKAVARDFSLDGNLLRSSHRVHRRPWVAQAAVGISSQWQLAGHGLRLVLMRVWRSREFDEQSGPHAFGSLALNIDF